MNLFLIVWNCIYFLFYKVDGLLIAILWKLDFILLGNVFQHCDFQDFLIKLNL
jgi:hypothetical protein